MSSKHKKQLTTGHICCGAGGDILGAKMAGAKPVWGFDLSESAIQTAKANHPDVLIHQGDIKNMDCDFPRVDLVICGIPCQPFTSIGRRLQEKDERDISYDVAEKIKKIRPDFLIFENVREYQKSKGFEILNNELAEYTINWHVLNVADYGIPQRRIRLFGLGSLGGYYNFPKPTHSPISDLYDQRIPWQTFKSIRNGKGMSPLSSKAIKGIWRRNNKHIAKGNGFSIQIVDDDDMCPTVLGNIYRGSGTSSNSIMVYDKGILRNMTYLESKRGQGFPDDYIFCGRAPERWQQIANAIPPLMAKMFIGVFKHD